MSGSYRILGRIGSGGMAEVFLGKVVGAAGFEKNIAIKSILPAYTSDHRLTALLIEEARIATILNHANIVQVLDFGQVRDRYYIVMEYVEGANLECILKNASSMDQPLPMALAGFICRQVLNGLAFVQERRDASGQSLNLVHRDVSPPNILLSRAGEVKLADFGIAKATCRAIVTEAGMIRGKIAYMSPEQAAGGELDHRSDLFSLGLVLYEMLTGRELYSGQKQAEILQKARQPDIKPPSNDNPMVPSELDAVVMRALETSPRHRFESARAFDLALENAMLASDLRASNADLEDWLKKVMPAMQVDELAVSDRLLTFDGSSAAPAQGTEPILEVGQLSKEGQNVVQRPSKSNLGMIFVLVSLLVGIAVVITILAWPKSKPSAGQTGAGQSDSAISPVTADAGSDPDAGTLAQVQADQQADGGVIQAQADQIESADRVRVVKKIVKPKGQGTVFINSEPWAKVIIDGKDSGVTTPTVNGLKLKAGRHRIKLINPEVELSYTFFVTLKKDEVVKRFVDLKRDGVQH
ncbi:MAG: serine/threonine protein kinase [Deltaproteobacteria bacterium]|nr:serine/threonine protein kinase [Deltaproteobacteria bacterium]